jgi:hypothetical protein
MHPTGPAGPAGQKEKSEGPWQKWGVVFTFCALLLAYIGTASQLHWIPFSHNSQITPPSSTASNSQLSTTLFPPIEDTTPRLSLSPSSGPPGSTITVTGTSFTPNSLVTFDFQAVQMVQKESNAKGAVKVSFVIPSEFDNYSAGVTFSVDATDSMENNAEQTFTLT